MQSSFKTPDCKAQLRKLELTIQQVCQYSTFHYKQKTLWDEDVLSLELESKKQSGSGPTSGFQQAWSSFLWRLGTWQQYWNETEDARVKVFNRIVVDRC